MRAYAEDQGTDQPQNHLRARFRYKMKKAAITARQLHYTSASEARRQADTRNTAAMSVGGEACQINMAMSVSTGLATMKTGTNQVHAEITTGIRVAGG